MQCKKLGEPPVVPATHLSAYSDLTAWCLSKTNGFVMCKLYAPERPRTRSQQNLLHLLLTRLAEHCGYTMNEVKQVMKEDVVGWPVKLYNVGSVVREEYMSEADASVELENAAISWCEMRLAELGVVV
jgi:hypothetical protein